MRRTGKRFTMLLLGALMAHTLAAQVSTTFNIELNPPLNGNGVAVCPPADYAIAAGLTDMALAKHIANAFEIYWSGITR